MLRWSLDPFLVRANTGRGLKAFFFLSLLKDFFLKILLLATLSLSFDWRVLKDLSTVTGDSLLNKLVISGADSSSAISSSKHSGGSSVSKLNSGTLLGALKGLILVSFWNKFWNSYLMIGDLGHSSSKGEMLKTELCWFWELTPWGTSSPNSWVVLFSVFIVCWLNVILGGFILLWRFI